MTAFLVENLKLIMLFMLIGSLSAFHTSMARRPSRRTQSVFAATADLHRLAARGVKHVCHRT